MEAGPPRKRSKLADSTAHVVPPPNADDEISFGRNLELLQAEMGKKNQRSDAIKQLMSRTFANRWQKYTDPLEPEPSSLNQYLSEYPCLKKLSYVSNFVYTSTCHLFYNNSTCIMIVVFVVYPRL